MNAEILLHWREQSETKSEAITPERRRLIELDGSPWAVNAEGRPGRVLSDAEDRKRRFARLQQRYYATGLKLGPFEFPPLGIRIVRTEAHPLALYVATQEIVGALLSLGLPDAVTVAEIGERFPNLNGPRWLRECEDSDFVDFAMDAAGYEWTDQRSGPKRLHLPSYVYVLRGLDHKQRFEAIKELKARARRAMAQR